MAISETPEACIAALPPCDAAIHMACDFNTDMGAIDRRLLDALLPALAANKPVHPGMVHAADGGVFERFARAFARRFGATNEAPRIISTDAIAAELGEWARGYALDQQLSGAKARRELGWAPRHLDPEAEVTGHGSN